MTISHGEMLYLDGRFQGLADGCIAVEDRGFQFGDGVYEVIKVVNGRLLWLDEHLARLQVSLGHVRITGVFERHPLAEVLPDLVRLAGLGSGTVYLQVTRGVAPRELEAAPTLPPTVLAYTQSREFPTSAELLRGIALHPVEDYRWGRCDIKATNLLAAVLARQDARAAGAQEAVWVGPDAVIREGTASNVFAVAGGEVRTHPADRSVLDGVTRQKVLALAATLGRPVVQVPVTLGALFEADEVFVTSTSRDVMPVVRVGDRAIADGRPGPITLELADAVRRTVALLAGLPEPERLSVGR